MSRLPPGAVRPTLVPLHAGLSNDEQLKAFLPAEKGSRKVIISTNIAEASVTIEGIKFVIDSGFVKVFSLANVLDALAQAFPDTCVQSHSGNVIPRRGSDIESGRYTESWTSRKDIQWHMLPSVHQGFLRCSTVYNASRGWQD